LRHLTLSTKSAVTEPSPMMKEEKAKSLLESSAEKKEAPAEAAAE